MWQRERLFAAMVAEVAERGYRRTTPRSIARRASLAEQDFRAHFAGKQECFLATFDSLVRQLHARALAAYRMPADDWRSSVRRAIATLLCAPCSFPQSAHLCLVESRELGAAGAERRRQAIGLFEDAIAEMLAEAPRGGNGAGAAGGGLGGEDGAGEASGGLGGEEGAGAVSGGLRGEEGAGAAGGGLGGEDGDSAGAVSAGRGGELPSGLLVSAFAAGVWHTLERSARERRLAELERLREPLLHWLLATLGDVRSRHVVQ